MTRYRIIQQLPESSFNKYPYAVQYYIEGYEKTIKAKWFWQKDKIVKEEGKWVIDRGELFKEIGVKTSDSMGYRNDWYAIFSTIKEADDALNKVIMFRNNIAANKAFTPTLMRETDIE